MNETFDVALIDKDIADRLLEIGKRVWVSPSTNQFFIYPDVADANLDAKDFTLMQMDETLNFGTYPVPRNRRMFPRKVSTS